MKLGVSFTVFNGTELLCRSFKSIKPFADVVHLRYQKTSNRGREIDPRDMDNILKVDCEHHLYEPDLSLSTKENERRKHQAMIDELKAEGCTHFLLMACDEFYAYDDLMKWKDPAMEYDVTYTKMFTYYKYPTWQLDPPEDYFKPFICRIRPNTKITPFDNYPVKVDPSVRVFPVDTFAEIPIRMHHYSMIRQDIKSKFMNAASSVNWTSEQIERFTQEYEGYDMESNPGVEYFKGRKIKVVPNYFGL